MASLEEARKTVVSAANKRRCKKSIVQPVHVISEGKFWSSTLSEETASQLSDLVVNLKALYTILPEPGLSFAAALFRKIHEEKLVPLAKKSQSIGVKNVLSRWEELCKAIVGGVLDLLDANPSQDYARRIANSLFRPLCETLLATSSESFSLTGAELCYDILLLLIECTRSSLENRTILRTLLTGANVGSLLPRLTNSSSLGALFDLLGVILPGNKTEDVRREREAFLRQTFSGLASMQSKLVAVVEQSGKDWSRTPENIIRELARGDLRFPQPFAIDHIAVGQRAFALKMFYVDGDCFLGMTTDDEDLRIMFTSVESMTLPGADAHADCPVVVHQQHAPKLGVKPLSFANGGIPLATFRVSNAEVERFKKALTTRMPHLVPPGPQTRKVSIGGTMQLIAPSSSESSDDAIFSQPMIMLKNKDGKHASGSLFSGMADSPPPSARNSVSTNSSARAKCDVPSTTSFPGVVSSAASGIPVIQPPSNTGSASSSSAPSRTEHEARNVRARPVRQSPDQRHLENIFGRNDDALSDISEFSPANQTSLPNQTLAQSPTPSPSLIVDKKRRRILTQEAKPSQPPAKREFPLPAAPRSNSEQESSSLALALKPRSTTIESMDVRSSSTLVELDQEVARRLKTNAGISAVSREKSPMQDASATFETRSKRRLNALQDSAAVIAAPVTPDRPAKRAHLEPPTKQGATVMKKKPAVPSRVRKYGRSKRDRSFSPPNMTASTTGLPASLPEREFTLHAPVSGVPPFASPPVPRRAGAEDHAAKKKEQKKHSKKRAMAVDAAPAAQLATDDSAPSFAEAPTLRKSASIKAAKPRDVHSPPTAKPVAESTEAESMRGQPRPVVIDTLVKAEKVKAKAERAAQARLNLRNAKAAASDSSPTARSVACTPPDAEYKQEESLSRKPGVLEDITAKDSKQREEESFDLEIVPARSRRESDPAVAEILQRDMPSPPSQASDISEAVDGFKQIGMKKPPSTTYMEIDVPIHPADGGFQRLAKSDTKDTDMIDLTQSPPSEKTLAASGDRTLGNFHGSPPDINMSPPSFDISMVQAMPSPSPSSVAPESAPRSTAPIRSPLANATNLRRVTFAPLVEERRVSPARPSPALRNSVSHGRARTVLGLPRSRAQPSALSRAAKEAEPEARESGSSMEMLEIAEVLKEINDALLEKIGSRFDRVYDHAYEGRQRIYDASRAELKSQRHALISTHNSLVDLEAEYATWGRRCLEGLQAAESARSRAVAAVQGLIEEHDRGLLSKKLPRKITPTELPVSCRV